MRQSSPTRDNQIHRFPPTGAEGRNLDGVCDMGALPKSRRHEITGPTQALPWVNSPLSSPTRHPAVSCSHSPNPAPVVLAEVFADAPPPGSPSLGVTISATPRPPCHSLSPCSTQHSERGVAFPFPGGFKHHPLPRSRCSSPHASLRVDPTPGRCCCTRSDRPAHRPDRPRLQERRSE